MSTDLAGVQSTMNRLGQTDPLLAMLPARLRGRINKLEDYFAFGQDETNQLVSYLRSLPVTLEWRRALDFGCGLGRSTQALAQYFDDVYGVDIASSILEIARAHNHHPKKCHYILNEQNDLSRFADGSLDFIWSSGVLYLMPPALSKNYIAEFVRVLAPGGVAVFQLPSVPARNAKGVVFRLVPTAMLNAYRRFRYGFEVYPIKCAEIIAVVERAGGRLVDIRDDSTVGTNYVSYQYCLEKPLTGANRRGNEQKARND